MNGELKEKRSALIEAQKALEENQRGIEMLERRRAEVKESLSTARRRCEEVRVQYPSLVEGVACGKLKEGVLEVWQTENTMSRPALNDTEAVLQAVLKALRETQAQSKKLSENVQGKTHVFWGSVAKVEFEKVTDDEAGRLVRAWAASSLSLVSTTFGGFVKNNLKAPPHEVMKKIKDLLTREYLKSQEGR